ncbi:4117_t:CDS:1, partial [Cetraspora pellucida]
SINGSNNDKNHLGVVNMSFLHEKVARLYYADNPTYIMIPTLGNYSILNNTVNCVVSLFDNFPSSRCFKLIRKIVNKGKMILETNGIPDAYIFGDLLEVDFF